MANHSLRSRLCFAPQPAILTRRSLARAIAIVLASLQTTTSISLYAALIWSTQSATTLAQTPEPTPEQLEELLEEARQRLRERGILPPTTPLPVEPLPEIAPSLEPDPDTEFGLYRLGIGDSIGVTVFRFPDLSFQATIDLEGNITVPLLGKISLAGLTLEAAQERIRFGLNRYIIDPNVTVSLIGIRPVQVTISGEVVRPGFYPLNPPFVSAAILVAGGTTQEADLREISVRRTLSDGTVLERTIDLFTPLKNAESLPDLRLQDGDAVIVSALDPDDLTYDRALVSSSTLAQQQIRVQVLSYAGGGIGTILLPNGSNFVDALAAIRPNPDIANIQNIALIRFDPEQRKAVTRLLDGKDAILGDFTENPTLRDNDVIVIGRNLVSRITFALSTFTQPFRDILGFLLFFQQLQQGAENLFAPGQQDENNNDN